MRTAPEGGPSSIRRRSTLWPGRTTCALVDLDAIAHNVGALRRHVAPAALMTVVKGNAYGHGLVAVARAAVEAGASWLGVYTAGEGARLRSGGIDARILVLGPFTAAEAETMLAIELTPTLSTAESVHILAGLVASGTVPVHVEVDTGMTRAGVARSHLLELLDTIRSAESLLCEGLFTHLAGAGFPGERSAVEQLRVFRELLDDVTAAGHTIPLVHAANSAGALNFPEAYLSMVRVGISTYGYYPSRESERTVRLHPALTLRSAVIRVDSVPPGTGVGYNHDFVAERPSTIALVPIGYADGLHRTLGIAHGRVLIRGRSAPIVGRVSMDQITVDATEVPGISVGDDVIVIGQQGG